jgi:hypothetical protein
MCSDLKNERPVYRVGSARYNSFFNFMVRHALAAFTLHERAATYSRLC